MTPARAISLPTTLEDLVRPDRMALVVYDMQVGILRQMEMGPKVTGEVARVLAAAREGGFPVVFLRHLSLPKRLTGVFGTRTAMAWQRTTDPDAISPWFLRDSDAFGITPDLAPRADEAVFDKIGMSAFEGTPLATVLRDLGLVSFALVGCATEIGLEPTVRHAADLGLIPVLVEDACGAGHAEAGARAVESLRFMGDAEFTDVATMTRLMTRP